MAGEGGSNVGGRGECCRVGGRHVGGREKCCGGRSILARLLGAVSEWSVPGQGNETCGQLIRGSLLVREYVSSPSELCETPK